MYYEEKLIQGVLMCRNHPNGDWRQVSIEKISQDLVELKRERDGLMSLVLELEKNPATKNGIKLFDYAATIRAKEG